MTNDVFLAVVKRAIPILEYGYLRTGDNEVLVALNLLRDAVTKVKVD